MPDQVTITSGCYFEGFAPGENEQESAGTERNIQKNTNTNRRMHEEELLKYTVSGLNALTKAKIGLSPIGSQATETY